MLRVVGHEEKVHFDVEKLRERSETIVTVGMDLDTFMDEG